MATNDMCSKPNGIPPIVKVQEPLRSKLLNHFKGEKHGHVQVGKEKWFYPQRFEKLAPLYYNFEVRPDDIWLLGYPRSGTTVTQEILWLLSHDLDMKRAEVEDINFRVPFFDGSVVVNEETKEELVNKGETETMRKEIRDKIDEFADGVIEILNNRKERRVIKTHLPIELLPPNLLTSGAKIIYICRYPKDVAVSFYHLQKNNDLIQYRGDFETYWDFFQNNWCTYTPFFSHVKQGWNIRHLPNVKFNFYENLGTDTKTYIKELATFLEKDITSDMVDKIADFISFDGFKKRVNKLDIFIKVKEGNQKEDKELAGLVRQGKSGGWREFFTDEMNLKADKWIEENEKAIGVKFPRK